MATSAGGAKLRAPGVRGTPIIVATIVGDAGDEKEVAGKVTSQQRDITVT